MGGNAGVEAALGGLLADRRLFLRARWDEVME